MYPIRVLREAIRAVPAVRFALAVAGIAAVVATVLGFKLRPEVAVFGTLIVIGLMFILVLFARYAGQENTAFVGPAVVLVWFYTLAVVATTTLFITSYFWHRPLDFKGSLPPAALAEKHFQSVLKFDHDSFTVADHNNSQYTYGATQVARDASLREKKLGFQRSQ